MCTASEPSKQKHKHHSSVRQDVPRKKKCLATAQSWLEILCELPNALGNESICEVCLLSDSIIVCLYQACVCAAMQRLFSLAPAFALYLSVCGKHVSHKLYARWIE